MTQLSETEYSGERGSVCTVCCEYGEQTDISIDPDVRRCIYVFMEQTNTLIANKAQVSSAPLIGEISLAENVMSVCAETDSFISFPSFWRV